MDRTIVELIPTSIIFAISRIMTPTESSVMIADCIEVIDGFRFGIELLFIAWLDVDLFLFAFGDVGAHRGGVNHVLGHINALRENDIGFILLFPNYPFAFESLQVKNQNFWGLINHHFFCRQFMVLAPRAIPFIPFFQLLWSLHHLKTLVDGDCHFLCLFFLKPFGTIIKFLQPLETKLSKPILIELGINFYILKGVFAQHLDDIGIVVDFFFRIEFDLFSMIMSFEAFLPFKVELKWPIFKHEFHVVFVAFS